MEKKRKIPPPAYVVMAIVWSHVFLVQVAIRCHCVPGPSGIPSDSAYMIPVVFGTCIVHHVVWEGLGGVSSVTAMRDGSLLIVLDPPKTFPRG